MKILFLCAEPPRPEGPCDTVVAFNRIRLLAERGHAVGLACFAPPRSPLPAGLDGMLMEMQMLPVPRRTPAAALGQWFANPYLRAFRALRSRDMEKLAGRLVRHSRYEAIVAESVAMGQYLHRNVHLPAVRRVICCHGSLAARYRRDAGLDLPWPQRVGAAGFLAAIESYETGLYRAADRLLTLSVQERLQLLRRFPELTVDVVPFGVEPAERPSAGGAAGAGGTVWFRGSFSDRAERAALRWLLREVWGDLSARRPETRLMVSGEGLRGGLRRLCRRYAGVAVSNAEGQIPGGAVPVVLVCPVRVEAGLQPRVLEAMAAGIPVVTTSAGAEGLPVQTGEHLFLADTPHAMREALQLLLDDADLRRSVSQSARQLTAGRFSWRGSVDRLEESLRRLVA